MNAGNHDGFLQFSRFARFFRVFQLFHLLRILCVLARYQLFYRRHTRGARLRLALESLGPIFIKAGQLLSTRRDVLPEDVSCELAKLQDQVPAFCGDLAAAKIERTLGAPLSDLFRQFDRQALASASIAQVHAAESREGTRLVVKLLRPGVRRMIRRDIRLLHLLASLAERFFGRLKRFRPVDLVSEIAHTLQDELDLQREAANASQLARNFSASCELHIPRVDWALSKKDVLVMERVDGIPICQVDRLRREGFNVDKIAGMLLDIFFTQVFRDSFFHADLHPGNIFVSGSPQRPVICLVDFGMAGSLNTRDQRYLAENLMAFFHRDYQRVAELHVASGWVPADTRIDQFESDIRAVCEPVFGQPAASVSLGQLLMRLFQTARRYRINIQPQLVLLQKTLLNVEGVCRQLSPHLDLWKIAEPCLERWMKKQVGIRAFFRRVRENLPYWSEKLPEIPGLFHDLLQKVYEDKIK